MQDSSNIHKKIFYFFFYFVIIGIILFIISTAAAFILRSSSEFSLTLFPILFVLLPPLSLFYVTTVVYADAIKLKVQGAEIRKPLSWAIASFFIIGLAIYLSFRKVDFKKQIEDKLLLTKTPPLNL